jgi:hypothetical protein
LDPTLSQAVPTVFATSDGTSSDIGSDITLLTPTGAGVIGTQAQRVSGTASTMLVVSPDLHTRSLDSSGSTTDLTPNRNTATFESGPNQLDVDEEPALADSSLRLNQQTPRLARSCWLRLDVAPSSYRQSDKCYGLGSPSIG